MAERTDAAYFTHRATQARTAAARAGSAGATGIHDSMAIAYDDLARQARAPDEPRDVPSKVVAIDGAVQVEGLDGDVVCFTPNAARATSDSLLRGANQAASQGASASLGKATGS